MAMMCPRFVTKLHIKGDMYQTFSPFCEPSSWKESPHALFPPNANYLHCRLDVYTLSFFIPLSYLNTLSSNFCLRISRSKQLVMPLVKSTAYLKSFFYQFCRFMDNLPEKPQVIERTSQNASEVHSPWACGSWSQSVYSEENALSIQSCIQPIFQLGLTLQFKTRLLIHGQLL